MGPCFALAIPELEELQKERAALHRIGVDYLAWRAMTRWQRLDYQVQDGLVRQKRAKAAKGKKLSELVPMVLARLLGIQG